MGIDITKLLPYVQFFEGSATILAIIIGGIWTWMLFIKKRQIYPRANISHSVRVLQLPDRKQLLHLTVNIENIGDVMVSLQKGEVRVLQVLPLTDEFLSDLKSGRDPVHPSQNEVDWCAISVRNFSFDKGSCEIEPLEKDSIFGDFIVDEDVEIVMVYSHFMNEKKRKKELGWSCSSIENIKEKVHSQP